MGWYGQIREVLKHLNIGRLHGHGKSGMNEIVRKRIQHESNIPIYSKLCCQERRCSTATYQGVLDLSVSGYVWQVCLYKRMSTFSVQEELGTTPWHDNSRKTSYFCDLYIEISSKQDLISWPNFNSQVAGRRLFTSRKTSLSPENFSPCARMEDPTPQQTASHWLSFV